MDFRLLVASALLCLISLTEQRRLRHEGGRLASNRNSSFKHYKGTGRHHGQGHYRRSRFNRKSRKLQKLLPYEAEENVKVRERMNVSLWKVTSQNSVEEGHRLRRHVTDDPNWVTSTGTPKLTLLRSSVARRQKADARQHSVETSAVWPLPRHIDTVPGRVFRLDPDVFYFSLGTASKSCRTLTAALGRYHKHITGSVATGQYRIKTLAENGHTPSVTGDPPTLTHVEVTVLDTCSAGSLHHSRNEMYHLHISERAACIRSRDVWGGLRALETFSQLVYPTGSHSRQLQVNQTDIIDFPRLAHRGVIINSSRRPINTVAINNILRLMEQNKLNMLHWVLSVHQTLNLVSDTQQNLSGKSDIYSSNDVADILDQARLRGIQVIPEVDILGNINTRKLPSQDLIIDCNHDNVSGILDISNNSTYFVIRKMLGNIITAFPDSPITLGPSHVNTSCWFKSLRVKRFMEEMGLGDFFQLSGYHAQRLAQIVKDLDPSRELILREEAQDDYDAVIQVQNLVKTNMAKDGFRRVYSWCNRSTSRDQDWEKFYLSDPFTDTVNPSLLTVVGGEICIWGEDVNKPTPLPAMWPEIAAVAERMWSAPYVRNVANARMRLDQQKCRMIRREIPFSGVNVAGPCELHGL